MDIQKEITPKSLKVEANKFLPTKAIRTVWKKKYTPSASETVW